VLIVVWFAFVCLCFFQWNLFWVLYDNTNPAAETAISYQLLASSLIPQRLYRIKERGLVGGVESEKHSHEAGKSEREQNRKG